MMKVPANALEHYFGSLTPQEQAAAEARLKPYELPAENGKRIMAVEGVRSSLSRLGLMQPQFDEEGFPVDNNR